MPWALTEAAKTYSWAAPSKFLGCFPLRAHYTQAQDQSTTFHPPCVQVVDPQCNVHGHLAPQAVPAHRLWVVAQRAVQVAALQGQPFAFIAIISSAHCLQSQAVKQQSCLSAGGTTVAGFKPQPVLCRRA